MSFTRATGCASRVAWRVALAFIPALLLLLPGDAAGQEVSPVGQPTVRLADVLEMVERLNPRLAAAEAMARAARARVPAASRPADPQLQLGWMNYELPELRPMQPLGMTQLQLMQMVPVAGQLRLSGDIARARADVAATMIDDVRLELRARSAMSFYDLYAIEGALGVASETKRLLEDIAAVADRMYQVGEGRQADVLRARVEIARMEEEIIRMQTMRAVEQANLNALLVRPAGSPIGAPVLPSFPRVPASVESLVARADQHRPLLRAGAKELEAAERRSTLAVREIWPDLLVGVQLGQRSGAMGVERMGSLMIGASIPVFARSRQLPMRTEMIAMQVAARAELDAMRTETSGSVAAASADLDRARRLAELYRTSVLPQAEATVASSRAAYRVGDVPFMTLIDAQMMLNRYRQELFTLEADEGKAWTQLEMLTGRVLVDETSTTPTRPLGEVPR